MRIVIDTREQKPLQFRKAGIIEGTIIKKLDIGDYSIEGMEDKIAIERKSANDLFGTLGKGHKRFKKEIEKSLTYDYFVIVVECAFHNVLKKEFEGAHWSQMRGGVIAQMCFTISIKYKIPVYFCNGRSEATSLIRNILKCYQKCKG